MIKGLVVFELFLEPQLFRYIKAGHIFFNSSKNWVATSTISDSSIWNIGEFWNIPIGMFSIPLFSICFPGDFKVESGFGITNLETKIYWFGFRNEN